MTSSPYILSFVFWANRKPNAILEIYKAFQDRLTSLNRHTIVWFGWTFSICDIYREYKDCRSFSVLKTLTVYRPYSHSVIQYNGFSGICMKIESWLPNWRHLKSQRNRSRKQELLGDCICANIWVLPLKIYFNICQLLGFPSCELNM